ncbi:hypothetical protein N9V38_03790, partial [Planktomarina temperata]|nr:hypothetical protein [Planktomarina temperata]
MTKHSPFRYFKTSPEIIRLAVMLYVRFSIRYPSQNPKKCVCASVAHVLSVTLSQRKSTKEVYRKLMRNMRT